MADSPAANGQGESRPNEQISFQFCRECSNMLYPKEDETTNTLMFACRTCKFAEPATSSCVFRNQINNSAGETAGVTQDVGSDPTVNIPVDESMCCLCSLCGNVIECDFCHEVCYDDAAALKNHQSGGGHANVNSRL